ncbi:hypothetical protein VF21_05744 [Pseudogymnoascus sp. 05NY08]|nr:hypothetical protein VF21_05744 [Pseudogymnoascus sp. 05NY08]
MGRLSGDECPSSTQQRAKFQSYQNTFDTKTSWVQIPKDLIFVSPFQSFSEDLPSELDFDDCQDQEVHDGDDIHGLEALSYAVAITSHTMQSLLDSADLINTESSNNNSSQNYSMAPFKTTKSPMRHGSETLFSAGHRSDVDTLARVQNASSKVAEQIDQVEVAFLMKHFSETTGPWMDLFDLNAFFARRVPVESLSNQLLQQAACAYAAKQLCCVQSNTHIHNLSSKNYIANYHHSNTTDWSIRATNYYDKAICLLREDLALNYSRLRSDNTLAAAAILCVCEFMEHKNAIWSIHLSGTKTLFDLILIEGAVSISCPQTTSVVQRCGLSTARQAIFWNFARQDYLAAFINGHNTRLNPDDLNIWRAAGLILDDTGMIVYEKATLREKYESDGLEREDLVSNALIWILCKLSNYLAKNAALDSLLEAEINEAKDNLRRQWQQVKIELENWYNNLSVMFKPCARLPPLQKKTSELDSSPREVFGETWFSLPMCASTMQSYHMACTLMELNKPTDLREQTVNGNANSLSFFRALVTKVNMHSHEICAIALSCSDEGVRIHSVQPLFIAGQCLVEPVQRAIIVDLLRAIESDLAWATEYRVQKLFKDWTQTA